MRKFYVIRQGWNAANQSSLGAKANPKNAFESRLKKLVAVVDAESPESACEMFTGTVYNGQFIYAVSNPRSEKGLTDAIRARYSD